MRISKVFPKANHRLYIIAEDGREGLFDVSPYLRSDAFEELQDESNFRKLTNGKYFIEWECGVDLSVDTIEAGWET